MESSVRCWTGWAMDYAKKTTINGQVYMNTCILKEKLPNFINIQNISHFQQDGAPCHGTKAVKSWLKQNRIPPLEPCMAKIYTYIYMHIHIYTYMYIYIQIYTHI